MNDLSSFPGFRGASDSGVQRGVFCGFDPTLAPMVAFGDGGSPRAAIATIALAESDCGSEVIVLFEHGGEARPIIVGLLPPEPHRGRALAPPPSAEVRLDGDRVVLRADRQIELRCGEASITLTRAGKVLIKGAYVLSRAKGANKIKGAYVDIN